MIKRSLTLKGHRTSVSLEEEFWELLERYAEKEKRSLSSVIEQVDEARAKSTESVPCLASALRVFVVQKLLRDLQNPLARSCRCF